MKKQIFNYLKNISGWTTKRKILCFAVDDYGNIRMHDKPTSTYLKNKGCISNNRFDNLDTLETSEDLKYLYEVLDTVKDSNSKPALFTTYALVANIDFERIKHNYQYELLPDTFERLAKENKKYKNTFDTIQSGITHNFIKPQFHGREHLNISLFEHHLRDKQKCFMENLSNKSYAGIPINPAKPTVKFTQSFAFWQEEEVENHKNIIKKGLNLFEDVYGYKSLSFTPPSQQIHPKLFSFLESEGVKAIDKPRKTKRHIGKNIFKKENNKLGIQKNENHVTIVRNAVFEPNSNKNLNWVESTFKQVQAAFRMQKPAIVSSHRVNFCGHISTENRKDSLLLLKALLCKIVENYPDVEFMSVDQLAEEIIRTSSVKI